MPVGVEVSAGSIEGQKPTNMQTQNNTGQGRPNKKKRDPKRKTSLFLR